MKMLKKKKFTNKNSICRSYNQKIVVDTQLLKTYGSYKIKIKNIWASNCWKNKNIESKQILLVLLK